MCPCSGLIIDTWLILYPCIGKQIAFLFIYVLAPSFLVFIDREFSITFVSQDG